MLNLWRGLALAVLCAFSAPAFADDDPMAFARAGMSSTPTNASGTFVDSAPMRLSGAVPDMIARHVAATIGPRWINTALRIAKIESGFRCGARNGRAVGVFQNIDPARFGVSRRAALTCSGGVMAGVAHMAACIRLGARTDRQMAVCHNTGNPFARRLERAYRNFA